MNSREKYIQSISQQMIADEEAIIKRLIQLREKRPKLYRSVPKAWQRAVVDYETEKKDVSHETNKRASLAKQS